MNTETETKLINCTSCGSEFEATGFRFGSRTVTPDTCKPCLERAAAGRRRAEEQDRHEARWKGICPPLYRDTDLNQMPMALVTAVEKWQYGPTGLGIIGDAGKCKTRAGFLILRKAFDDNVTVNCVSGARFSKLTSEQFFDDDDTRETARRSLQRLKEVGLVLFDDLGKGRLTDRVESELFDFLETRTSNCLPTIWTSNSTPDVISTMFSQDRADAIMRRLIEFSRLLQV